MADKDFVVSGDGHLLEPTDLFVTRLPKHLRERAVWEEDFEIEPFVEGGATKFRRLHTPGFEGWTVSRYRQTGGRMPEGDPEHILEDMDLEVLAADCEAERARSIATTGRPSPPEESCYISTLVVQTIPIRGSGGSTVAPTVFR